LEPYALHPQRENWKSEKICIINYWTKRKTPKIGSLKSFGSLLENKEKEIGDEDEEGNFLFVLSLYIIG